MSSSADITTDAAATAAAAGTAVAAAAAGTAAAAATAGTAKAAATAGAAATTAPALGRPRDEARRADLSAAAAAELVTRGSCEISLRALADALGESPRMLVHHFGSRDALIAAALTHARAELIDRVQAQLAQLAPDDLPALVTAIHAVIVAAENRAAFRLFDEVNALSRTQPERFPGFGRASVHDWMPQFSDLLSASVADPATREAQATLALAVVRGLMLDLNATGENTRVAGAFASFAALAAPSR